jgi:hypothetical protein
VRGAGAAPPVTAVIVTPQGLVHHAGDPLPTA